MVAQSSRDRRAGLAIVVLLAGLFLSAHVLGRSSDPGGVLADHAAPPASEPTPDPAAGSGSAPEPASGSGAAPEPGSGVGAAGRQARPVPLASGAGAGMIVPAPVAALRQVTGPGVPPLPRTGAGPFGSWQTTADAYVALTFDDGPDPRWTPRVLESLRRYGATATFCVVGELVEAHPELVGAIAADGHTLCNHTWSHDVGLGNRSVETIRDDLERTTAAIQRAAPGARVSYYRQPGGAWTQRVVEVAEELGMASLHWAVDPQDWQRPGASRITSEMRSGVSPGAIVLLHDGGGDRAGTVKALRDFLPELTDSYRVKAMPPGMDRPHRHGLELPARPGQL